LRLRIELPDAFCFFVLYDESFRKNNDDNIIIKKQDESFRTQRGVTLSVARDAAAIQFHCGGGRDMI
jgi:hypothetical protein